MKRCFDLLLGFVAGILALLPGIFLAAIAKIQFGRAFYVQTRIGKNEVPFQLFKIQSLGPNHQLSPFWAKVRSYGLDEIPQLWNILKGEMTWVGPRPLLPEYLEHYDARQATRHWVLPGIFGWSQLKQISHVLPWEERLELDAIYVEKHSLLFDFKILISSVFTLLLRARKNASDFERFNS